MAQELRFQVWCDLHPDVEATTVEITLAGHTRVLDLCDPCIDTLVRPLATAMENHGRIPSRVVIRKPHRQPTGTFPCTHPGCDRSYSHRRTLRTHVRQEHGMTLAELYRTHGDGDTRVDTPEQPGEYECPECGQLFTRSQGLGSHRWKLHGIPRKGHRR